MHYDNDMSKSYKKPIPKGFEPCFKCIGTGRYYGRGRVENGKFIGTIGKCFGCLGKGYQTKDDEARCKAYWRHNLPPA